MICDIMWPSSDFFRNWAFPLRATPRGQIVFFIQIILALILIVVTGYGFAGVTPIAQPTIIMFLSFFITELYVLPKKMIKKTLRFMLRERERERERDSLCIVQNRALFIVVDLIMLGHEI
ncbi:hypothetical protein ACJX0J_028985, partial [Zea mays]